MDSKHLTITGYSLMAIIIDRGKGSKIFEFLHSLGIRVASGFIGKEIVNNKFLQIIEMDEVNKEVIVVLVPSAKEDELLEQINSKYLEKHHGAAFIIPLAGIMNIKKDAEIKWNESNCLINENQKYGAMILIVDRGKEEKAIEICHSVGYYGSIVIKANGSASKLNIVLDMMVEPEKSAVLMLMGNELVDKMSKMMHEEFQLDKPNTGILIKMCVKKAIGCLKNYEHSEVRGK